MNKRVSDKSTKAEILEAYKEAAQEKSLLESQIQQLNASQKQTPAPEKPIVEAQKPMALTQNPQKMQSTIDNLILLQFGFGGAVSELSEKLTSEAAKLEELRRTVGDEIQQLQELHSLEDVAEDTLDNLIQQYEESAKTFAGELSEQRETVEQELLERRQAWEKEQELQKLAVKERNEHHQKARERDEELYYYDLNLQRNLDIEEYEQRQKRLYQEIEEFQQEQEKQWAEREKSISERQKQNYELQIQGMLQTIQNQDARLASLSKQLDSALKQVQDLAVKAIEGASNLSSLQAVREIAIEQAKTQQKNK